MKTCTQCRTPKHPEQFYRNAKMRDGLYAECKTCVCAKSAAWKKANRARHLDSSKAWNSNNAERKTRTDAAWRARNPLKAREYSAKRRRLNPDLSRLEYKNRSAESRERMRIRSRAWVRANPIEARAKARAWQRANPGKSQASCARRRSKILDALCTCCGTAAFKDLYARARVLGMHVDHVHPLSKGGRHCLLNLQLLTPLENMRKGSRLP